MQVRSKIFTAVALTTLLSLGLPETTMAVQANTSFAAAVGPETGICTRESWEAAVPEADALHGQALSLMSSERPKKAKKAAGLFAKSAAMLPDCDPRVFESLRLAARLYHSEGNLVKARALMFKAAENGVATGRILDAANAYIDAALLATIECRSGVARLAADKARALTGSPLLTEADRLFIVSRIGVSDTPMKKSHLDQPVRRTIIPAATASSSTGS